MSVQYFTEASQKFTWPAPIVPEAGLTVALRVRIVPDATVVTDPEPVDTEREVVETTLVCAGATRLAPRSAMATVVEGMCWKVTDENQDLMRRFAL